MARRKEKKIPTLAERYANDIMTDNTKIVNFRQCADCVYRLEKGTEWDYLGFQKVTCQIFNGKDVPEKPLRYSLNEDDPMYLKCKLYKQDPDYETGNYDWIYELPEITEDD